MARERKFIWKAGPKSLISLIGVEHELLRKAGQSVLLRFYTASVIIVGIAILSIVSVFYLVELMFHNSMAEVVLSILLTGLFILMYIFLILTISNNAGRKASFSISNVTRIGFIMFMAAMLSKPVELFIFQKSINMKLEEFRARVESDHSDKIRSQYSAEMALLEKKLDYYESNNLEKSFDDQIAGLQSKINRCMSQQNQLIRKTKEKLRKSDFVIQQMKILHSDHPWTWGFTILVVFLYLLPGYLIFSISMDDSYYPIKEKYEKEIISREYWVFLKKYSEIFSGKFGLNVEYYSKFEDPPFNTRLKSPPLYNTGTAFFERFA